jgi:preprotein translocase SecE subunit
MGCGMSKDDATWLNIAYVMFAILMAFIAYKAIAGLGIQYGWIERYDEWFPTANNLGAIVIGGATAIWFRSDVNRREYHLSVVTEMRKVTWPTMDSTKKMTLIVAVVVAIFSVILSLFDIAWLKILQMIFP